MRRLLNSFGFRGFFYVIYQLIKLLNCEQKISIEYQHVYTIRYQKE